ncbi:MAG: HAD family phosphatase [Oscillospiraceae bacterium]|nr:HAD family phosphatase [Oscillospiraceae bacterium]
MAYRLTNNGTPRIRGVLFDMDGVVIDTEKLYTRFWMEAARELGFPMTLEQALQLRSLGKAPSQAKFDQFFGPGRADYTTIRSRRIELMDAWIAAHGVEAKPGIRELLAFLTERSIPRAITSSSSIPVIRRHLGNLGLLEGFTALCSGKDVPRGKPAPDIYLHGARVLGLKPEECLAIEDSPAGIEAAYRAGCRAVIIPDQDQPGADTLAMCHAQADSLMDIISLIQR